MCQFLFSTHLDAANGDQNLMTSVCERGGSERRRGEEGERGEGDRG